MTNTPGKIWVIQFGLKPWDFREYLLTRIAEIRTFLESKDCAID